MISGRQDKLGHILLSAAGACDFCQVLIAAILYSRVARNRIIIGNNVDLSGSTKYLKGCDANDRVAMKMNA